MAKTERKTTDKQAEWQSLVHRDAENSIWSYAEFVVEPIPELAMLRQLCDDMLGMRVGFPRRRFSKNVIVIAFAIGLACAYFYYLIVTDYRKNPARVAFIMNISELPRSVRDIECSAGAITDILVTCAFRIDPRDFELLLRGWNFKSEKINGNGRTYGMDAPLGPDFEAATKYVIHPDSFKNGGLVSLVTNREYSLVIANRFEE